MSEPDNSLIAEFNARRSEDAFAALVRQHANLVFATALRQVGDTGAAEEITQSVFVSLAQAAGKLGSHPTIAGWLHQTALNKSREWLRSELRRRRREKIAANRNLDRAEGNSVWSPLVPLLDEALLKLREPDRQAVILHYLEGRTFQEVGSALGVGEDAARKRVSRCLDQLTDFFRHRGFTVPALTADASLFALSSFVAPAGLTTSATTAGLAAAHSAVSSSTLTLIKGALKIMAWTKAKTAIVVGAAAILAAGTTVVVVGKVVHRNSWADDPRYWETDSSVLAKVPAGVYIFRPTRFANNGGSVWIGDRMSAKNCSVSELVNVAYGFSYTRTILPSAMPREHFDVMSTVADGYSGRVKNELKTRFHLTAHTETRPAAVLLLKVQNPNPPGLKPHSGDDGISSWVGGNRKTTIRNQEFNGFYGDIESRIGRPVINETGLTGKYDLEIQWQPRTGESDKDAYVRALREQLGLELVPANRPLEMLIVEKAK